MNTTPALRGREDERELIMRIVVIGADAELGRRIATRLSRDGFTLDVVTGSTSLPPGDLLIVCDDPPALDARALCRDLRGADHHAPIVVTSPRVRPGDRVKTLDAGADDYLVRPFSLAELAARVRAIVRRQGGNGFRQLEVANVRLDPVTRHVFRGQHRVHLTPKEYAVLECLMRHPGRPVSRETIAAHAWNKRWDRLTNEIDVFVSRLRRKLKRAGEPELLRPVRGVGYVIGSRSTRVT